jgi:drug/metabolite transporter (DMT)-like permease
MTTEPVRALPSANDRLRERRGTSMRSLVLVLVSIGCGLSALYLVRAALVHVGGFTLNASAPHKLGRLMGEWRFWTGAVMLSGVMAISLELYGSQDLSKVVPLYSLSYLIIALVGKFFLGEHVDLTRWLGIAAIMTGVILVQRT